MGGERDLLGCACAVPVLSPPTHTHTHPHMHSFPPPPSFPLSLSPLAGLACCHLPPLFLPLPSPPSHNTHTSTHTQMHGLGCTLLPPQHPTHPQGRREGKGGKNTQHNQAAMQHKHIPPHCMR